MKEKDYLKKQIFEDFEIFIDEIHKNKFGYYYFDKKIIVSKNLYDAFSQKKEEFRAALYHEYAHQLHKHTLNIILALILFGSLSTLVLPRSSPIFVIVAIFTIFIIIIAIRWYEEFYADVYSIQHKNTSKALFDALGIIVLTRGKGGNILHPPRWMRRYILKRYEK